MEKVLVIYFFFLVVVSLIFLVLCFNGRGNLLGLGRRSTIVGVETGVFFCALVTVAVAVLAGTALPDRA